MSKIFTAIGLMSGTSLDGIDAALVKTDGISFVEPLDFISHEYDLGFRDRLRGCLGQKEKTPAIDEVEKDLTLQHVDIVRKLLAKNPETLKSENLIIGFHGHTIFHDPGQSFTWQIGDGALLAQTTGIDVVNNFREADIKAGGQGAPLLPLYHQIITQNNTELKNKQFVSILNLGGVGNITYIDLEGDSMLAFDAGLGNAYLDDFIAVRTGQNYDHNGAIASQGLINSNIVDIFLSHDYFKKTPPKSLDRDEFTPPDLSALSTEDGAATLSEITVQSVFKNFEHLPQRPEVMYVCGGGRHNAHMMDRLNIVLGLPIQKIEELSFDGDAIEAQGFALFAVRQRLGLPISFKTTTGVEKDVICGHYHAHDQNS